MQKVPAERSGCRNPPGNARANYEEIAGLEVEYGFDLNVELARDDCAEKKCIWDGKIMDCKS